MVFTESLEKDWRVLEKYGARPQDLKLFGDYLSQDKPMSNAQMEAGLRAINYFPKGKDTWPLKDFLFDTLNARYQTADEVTKTKIYWVIKQLFFKTHMSSLRAEFDSSLKGYRCNQSESHMPFFEAAVDTTIQKVLEKGYEKGFEPCLYRACKYEMLDTLKTITHRRSDKSPFSIAQAASAILSAQALDDTNADRIADPNMGDPLAILLQNEDERQHEKRLKLLQELTPNQLNLSRKEAQVFAYYVSALQSNGIADTKKICQDLGMALGTVHTHMAHIRAKFQDYMMRKERQTEEAGLNAQGILWARKERARQQRNREPSTPEL